VNPQEKKTTSHLKREMIEAIDAIFELDFLMIYEEEAIIKQDFRDLKSMIRKKNALFKLILEAQKSSIEFYNRMHTELINLKKQWLEGPDMDDLLSMTKREWWAKLNHQIRKASQELKEAKNHVDFAFRYSRLLKYRRDDWVKALNSRKKEIDEKTMAAYNQWLESNGNVHYYQQRADNSRELYLEAKKSYQAYRTDFENGIAGNFEYFKALERRALEIRAHWKSIQDEVVRANLRAEVSAKMAREAYYHSFEAHKIYDELEQRIDLWDHLWIADLPKLPRHAPVLPQPPRFGLFGRFLA
jgi:transposase